ncbi:MAG: pilus assembly protein [Methylobacteriaceae bacterium]|nr:pilus assembly protein [Methylobacteriaceae bacterium]
MPNVSRLGEALTGFASDKNGNVAMMFGLIMVMMVALGGFAIDYSRASSAEVQLNSTADSVALAAVSVSGNPNLNQPNQAQAQAMFQAAAANIPGVTLTNVSLTSTPGVSGLSVTVNYTATIDTFFANFIGIPTLSLGGSASSARKLPAYVDFYLLLDNSPSMGLAATPTDISNMQALTPDSCAFACHQHSFDGSGNIIGDNLNDYYHLAKNNNITTRIDVLRSASQSLTTTAKGSETISNQFRMAIYTFSDTFQTIAGLSSDLSTVAANANAIDLAYAYYDQRDAQTSFDTALSYINTIMPDPGDGSNSSAPQEFLFFVTDGVEDEPAGNGSGGGDQADKPSSYQPPNTQPNLGNLLAGNVNSKRLITTINPSLCTAIKARGIKIAVLYTTYLPVTVNAFYNQWVAPISSSIPTQLQYCATPGFYFEVNPSQGIGDAMTKMFEQALSVARLTK